MLLMLDQQLMCLLAEMQTVATATGRSHTAQHPVSADLLDDDLSAALFLLLSIEQHLYSPQLLWLF